MRILIVDDELISRTKLELIMESFGECQTEDQGEAALTAFLKAHQNEAPFDLIMLDIDLPGMNGIKLLAAIRNTEKELDIDESKAATIIMTSAYRDKDRIVASVNSGCDDYIVKPFDPDLIRKKLDKLGIEKLPSADGAGATRPQQRITTGQIYAEIVNHLNTRQTELPSLSKIFIKFRELITLRASFTEIVNLLRKDIAISAEIIRRSNSAYYKGFAANKSLEQAVARMGYKATVQVVTELSIRKFFTMKVDKYRNLIQNLWQHSISSAYAAEFMSKLMRLNLSGDPFLLGLLHDIGKLALLQIIADMERRRKFNNGFHQIMLINILQDYHCQFGARLLEKWKFDECYIYTASNHNRSDLEPEKETEPNTEDPYHEDLLMVQSASRMVNSMGYDILGSAPSDMDLNQIVQLKHKSWRPDRISEAMTRVTERMHEVQELI